MLSFARPQQEICITQTTSLTTTIEFKDQYYIIGLFKQRNQRSIEIKAN